ncbi:vegetative cell wall protein gp1-like [Zea mays]|uniref:vegetative cell wall protein gp1-like n=1 Tax=Zea mays TaxID=4577 RepID=UPI0009AADF4E|nr:vegetative cell wall protein gp1-like [Zea mays]|eukprot:XP_020402670.1 vegetative cell wall protein gp1-like [Zea mays]
MAVMRPPDLPLPLPAFSLPFSSPCSIKRSSVPDCPWCRFPAIPSSPSRSRPPCSRRPPPVPCSLPPEPRSRHPETSAPSSSTPPPSDVDQRCRGPRHRPCRPLCSVDHRRPSRARSQPPYAQGTEEEADCVVEDPNSFEENLHDFCDQGK